MIRIMSHENVTPTSGFVYWCVHCSVHCLRSDLDLVWFPPWPHFLTKSVAIFCYDPQIAHSLMCLKFNNFWCSIGSATANSLRGIYAPISYISYLKTKAELTLYSILNPKKDTNSIFRPCIKQGLLQKSPNLYRTFCTRGRQTSILRTVVQPGPIRWFFFADKHLVQ